MGPSGSGKSTLLHCLAGILDAGRAARSIRRRPDRQPRRARPQPPAPRTFGFVFQFGQLVPELAAEENVALPLLLGGMRRPRRWRGRAWFDALGLAGLERRRPASCPAARHSGSRSPAGLVAGPEVLFADEPTGSLDSLAGEEVMELLVETAREHGTAVILVTHEARVAAYADREVIVRDGRVRSLSAPDRVMIRLGLRLA